MNHEKAAIFFRVLCKIDKKKQEKQQYQKQQNNIYATELTRAGNIEKWRNIKWLYVTSPCDWSKTVVVFINENTQLNGKNLDFSSLFIYLNWNAKSFYVFACLVQLRKYIPVWFF